MLTVPIIQYHTPVDTDDLIHWVCAHRKDTGFCGSVIDQGDTDEEANCVVCVDIESESFDGEDPVCPWTGRECDCIE